MEFQSTLPAWGETGLGGILRFLHRISIHSPRMGRDGTRKTLLVLTEHFNPLSPHGERRLYSVGLVLAFDFNPLSPHGERRDSGKDHVCQRPISIHSPRMGRDAGRHAGAARKEDFNPLSPHGERRGMRRVIPAIWRFQSTLPAWGETRQYCIKIQLPLFQSTLPAWGETIMMATTVDVTKFQSTLPAWGETSQYTQRRKKMDISIHSPRMGRDLRRRRLRYPG